MMYSMVQINSMVHSLFSRQLNLLIFGVPGGIRTHDLQLRRLMAVAHNYLCNSLTYASQFVPLIKSYPQVNPLRIIGSLLSYGTAKHAINGLGEII